MKKRLVVLIVWLTPMLVYSQTEWVLQPWMQVKGQATGEQLGIKVTRVIPRPNLPYKATIAKLGSFGFYSLESPMDTLPKRVFAGEDVLTGDLNNDGYTDIVFARRTNGYDTVYVMWGTPTGVDTLNSIAIAGENRNDGLTPLSVADVNNDGKLDLILTAPGYFKLPSKALGKLYFFFGPNFRSTPDTTTVGDIPFKTFGTSLAVGDLNADGLNDLVVRITGDTDYVNIFWGAEHGHLNLVRDLQLMSKSTSAVSQKFSCICSCSEGSL